jgi:hypothetical protein
LVFHYIKPIKKTTEGESGTVMDMGMEENISDNRDRVYAQRPSSSPSRDPHRGRPRGRVQNFSPRAHHSHKSSQKRSRGRRRSRSRSRSRSPVHRSGRSITRSERKHKHKHKHKEKVKKEKTVLQKHLSSDSGKENSGELEVDVDNRPSREMGRRASLQSGGPLKTRSRRENSGSPSRRTHRRISVIKRNHRKDKKQQKVMEKVTRKSDAYIAFSKSVWGIDLERKKLLGMQFRDRGRYLYKKWNAMTDPQRKKWELLV